MELIGLAILILVAGLILGIGIGKGLGYNKGFVVAITAARLELREFVESLETSDKLLFKAKMRKFEEKKRQDWEARREQAHSKKQEPR